MSILIILFHCPSKKSARVVTTITFSVAGATIPNDRHIKREPTARVDTSIMIAAKAVLRVYVFLCANKPVTGFGGSGRRRSARGIRGGHSGLGSVPLARFSRSRASIPIKLNMPKASKRRTG